MAYAFHIGRRYLSSKKRSTISVITFVAVTGVALGVGALLSVLAITTGFQREFRDKVLGVNAHVLVLKYGLDFREYPEVITKVRRRPDVAGAAPFVIKQMMITKGHKHSGVLVKGVDPKAAVQVLDLPGQIVDGSLDGLRLSGATAPMRPEDLGTEAPDDDVEGFLAQLAADAAPTRAKPDAKSDTATEMSQAERQALTEQVLNTPPGRSFLTADAAASAAQAGGAATGSAAKAADATGAGDVSTPAPDLPRVNVASPNAAEAALGALDDTELELEDDVLREQLFAEIDLEREARESPERILPGAVVGRTLARNLGIGVGDKVHIVSPLTGLDTSMWDSGARAPRSRAFRVIAIFAAGFQEYDASLVYVDLFEAQRFFDHGDAVTGVEIRLHDYEKAATIARGIEGQLGEGPYHTMDWAELNHNLFTALEIQKIMLSLVIATIIFVAAFNVIATLIMMVIEKKREVAILKAMGATDGTILQIFMVQGVVIGTVGTLLGLLLGGGVCAYLNQHPFPLDPKVYLIDHLPIHTSPTEFVVAAAVAMLICATSTLIPSWWAAQMLPVEGVRYE